MIWIYAEAAGSSILERLMRLETLLESHMAAQERLINSILYPILVGVALIAIRLLGGDLARFHNNHKNKKGGEGS
jgi:type II secretory pathway component PulF